jgi:hypothetical protein
MVYVERYERDDREQFELLEQFELCELFEQGLSMYSDV